MHADNKAQAKRKAIPVRLILNPIGMVDWQYNIKGLKYICNIVSWKTKASLRV